LHLVRGNRTELQYVDAFQFISAAFPGLYRANELAVLLISCQRVQNVLARVTAQAPWSVSATDLRRDLYWLPIRQRFIYKLSVLTYKAHHTGQPCYLADLIDSYEPSRCLRSTNSHFLAVPSCAKSSFASQTFCISSPNNWNSLSAYPLI